MQNEIHLPWMLVWSSSTKNCDSLWQGFLSHEFAVNSHASGWYMVWPIHLDYHGMDLAVIPMVTDRPWVMAKVISNFMSTGMDALKIYSDSSGWLWAAHERHLLVSFLPKMSLHVILAVICLHFPSTLREKLHDDQETRLPQSSGSWSWRRQ